MSAICGNGCNFDGCVIGKKKKNSVSLFGGFWLMME